MIWTSSLPAAPWNDSTGGPVDGVVTLLDGGGVGTVVGVGIVVESVGSETEKVGMVVESVGREAETAGLEEDGSESDESDPELEESEEPEELPG